MNEYELDITLKQRQASGDAGPRVPEFEPTGRIPSIGQLASLEALERAIASGQTDAQRIALTAAYARKRLHGEA